MVESTEYDYSLIKRGKTQISCHGSDLGSGVWLPSLFYYLLRREHKKMRSFGGVDHEFSFVPEFV